MNYSRPLGPRQRQTIQELGSRQLRSWVDGSTLRAPDALAAFAHLSDVLDRIRFDDNATKSIQSLITPALRQACKER